MRRPILTASIASLIALCVIGRPVPAFGEEPPDPNAVVPGEEPPDFSFLDEKGAAEEVAAPEVKPTETAKPAEATVKIPVVDPNDALEVPAIKPVQETKEQEIPDPKEEAERIAKEKQAADLAASEKSEADRKAAEEAAKSKPVVKLPTEEELDAMQPKPGAPAKVIADFKALKDDVVKPAIRRVKELEAELDTIRKAPALDEATKQKLARADEDRAWRESFELSNDPVLEAEFKGKTEKAEASLFKLLQDHPRLRMKPEAIKQLQEMGLDSEEGMAARKKILDAVKKLDDDMLLDEVKDGFKARELVSREKVARIAELQGKQGDLVALKAEREKGERMSWAKQCDDNLISIVKDDPTFTLKTIPETASAAEKAEAEAYNKHLKEKVVPEFQAGIRAIHARDPDATMKFLVASIRLPALTAERDQLKTQLQAALDRVKELEGDSSRMRRITSPSQAAGAPPPPKPGTGKAEVDLNQTAEEAADAYALEKGL